MQHVHELIDPIRPWRRATIAVTAVATLELIGLVAIGLFVFGNPLSNHLRESAAAASTTRVRAAQPAPAEKPELARAETSVMVLNGGGVSGAAHSAADNVTAHGYPVGEIGNAAGVTPRTLIMYRPGFAAEGKRLGHDLHVNLVRPLDGMHPAQLQGSHLVLILGR